MMRADTCGGQRWWGAQLACGITAMVALLSAGPARADLSVQLALENVTLLRMEPVVAFVTVINHGAKLVVLDPDRSADSAQMRFRVRRMGAGDAQMRAAGLPPILGVIEPGESRQFMVRLSDAYDFSTYGGYLVEAEVEHRGLRFASHPLHADVVTGLGLASVTRTSPTKPGAQLLYQLSYLTRAQAEHLFISVDEQPSGDNQGVYQLGRILRVFKPVLEVDASGGASVVHQSGPGMYTRSLLALTPQGLRLVDQSYKQIDSADGQWRLRPVEPTDPKKAKQANRNKADSGR